MAVRVKHPMVSERSSNYPITPPPSLQGHETKSMLNNSGPRYKRSKLERKLNIDVIYCVILLFAMCLVGAVGQWQVM